MPGWPYCPSCGNYHAGACPACSPAPTVWPDWTVSGYYCSICGCYHGVGGCAAGPQNPIDPPPPDPSEWYQRIAAALERIAEALERGNPI
jgi:hypothetical protein